MILLDTGMRKMPDKCSLCNFFRVESQMYCTAVVGYTTVSKPYERRPEWCPLHEDTDTDTISRKQAIDALFGILDRPKHADFLYADEIDRALKQLPPSPSRPHGHWIKHHESRAGIVYSCDRCGRTLQALSWETQKDVYKMYPFCHCGADMQC